MSQRLRKTLAAAYAAWDANDFESAADMLARAVRMPGGDQRQFWFDLALAHKFGRDWPAARDAGLAAVERGVEPKQDPTWWNLGIAATALRDWALARRAWRGYGIDAVEAGNDPIRIDFGFTPVRLHGRDGDEVVWAHRLCPARAKVMSVPLPESGRRWGEVVLHDGAPNGTREWDGATYSVFDEIELFEPSGTPTFAVRLDAAHDDVEALADQVLDAGWGVEAAANVRMVCTACSEGHLVDDHAHQHEHSTSGQHGDVLIAAPADVVSSTLSAWRAVDPAGRHHGAAERVL